MGKRLFPPRPLPRPSFTQVLTLVIAFASLFLIFNLTQKWLIAQDVLEEKRLLAIEVKAEQARVENLEHILAETESDAYIERVIREDFGWVRDNEGTVLLHLIESPAANDASTGSTDAGAGQAPFWSLWARLFLE